MFTLEQQKEFNSLCLTKPHWIECEKDWENYAAHLQYRLKQAKEMFRFLETQLNKNHNKIWSGYRDDLDKICDDYESAYNCFKATYDPEYLKMKFHLRSSCKDLS